MQSLAALALSDGLGAATILVAIVGLVTTVVLWRRGRQRKGIAYRLTTARVVSVRHEASDRITVLYDGTPVGDVRLLDLHVECSGNVAIATVDFDHPLAVSLGPGAQVLSSAVSNRSPPDLDVRVSLEGNSLSIEPLLLNQGDSFAVTALVSDLKAGNRLDGRVAGVSRFIDLDAPVRPTGVFAAARRIGLESSTLTAMVTIAAAAVGTAIALTFSTGKTPTETLVKTKRGMTVCGHIINSDQQALTMRLKGSGNVQQLRVAEVQAIREDAC